MLLIITKKKPHWYLLVFVVVLHCSAFCCILFIYSYRFNLNKTISNIYVLITQTCNCIVRKFIDFWKTTWEHSSWTLVNYLANFEYVPNKSILKYIFDCKVSLISMFAIAFHVIFPGDHKK